MLLQTILLHCHKSSESGLSTLTSIAAILSAIAAGMGIYISIRISKTQRDNDTLKQCNFYFQEFQIAYKELMESNISQGMPIEWKLLTSYTSNEVNEKYTSQYDKFNAIDRPIKNQAILTLNKLEAFASFFICGKFNKDLANSIIGKIYSKQVGSLLGIISYFRHDDGLEFGQNTIKLYNEWNKE